MKKLMIVAVVFTLVGCSLKPLKPVCTANYRMAGGEYTTSVYEVRKVGKQTMLRVGHPFNFSYVSVSNFTSNTCR